jgi:CDP-glucose 4,6-dehydratase
VRGVLIVTSDKCYRNTLTETTVARGLREDDPMGGFDPYSSSKGAAELATESYRNSFFHPDRYREHGTAVASARAGNVIGGGDWAKDRLIPDIVRALLAGEAPLIRNPRAVRPWQHVLEPLAGYLTLCEALVEQGPAVAEGWNFGPAPSDAQPVSWVADRMVELWGSGARWTLDNLSHPHEAALLYLDTTKARERVHYRPRWSLAQGLAATVAWAKAYSHQADPRATTLEQIETFMAADPTQATIEPVRSAHVGR